MTNSLAADCASIGYKNHAIDGLTDRQILLKGIHGIVVYIRRASMVRDQRARHLSNADRLLTYLISITDNRGDLGQALTTCYTGLQLLIGQALNAQTGAIEPALNDALDQAKALEMAVSEAVGGS